jgi:type VI secretion system protein VasJ
VLIAELLDRHWDALFPDVTRTKARANAVGWFLQRTTIALGGVSVSAADRDTVESLLPTAQRLAELARSKFAGAGPAFGPILEALERLALQLPPEAPPEPPPPPPPDPSATPAPAPAAASPTPGATPGAAAAPPPPAAGGDTDAYLGALGEALVTTAANLRRASAADPLAYRLLRTGLWLSMAQLPPKGPNGRSPFPPMRAALRTQLDTMAANAKTAELIEEAESALVQNRFNLDLSRFTARALAALGPTHEAARKALEAEVAAWLRRMPGAPELLANDGTPVADAQTRAWLEMELAAPAGGGGGGGAGAGVNDDTAAAVRDAKSLFAAGKSAEGLALLQSKVQVADSGHSRFRLRLELAKLCVAASQPALARALYSALAKECTVHDLDTWEPQLTVECLEGLLSCRPSGALSEEDSDYYQRLCRISPAAAMRIQT